MNILNLLLISTLSFFFADVTNWFIGNDFLPNTKFPIIFDKMKCVCEKVGKSSVNKEEAEAVVVYIEKLSKVILNNGHNLTQRDIGVVTPYSKQAELIREKCSEKDFDNPSAHHHRHITIGTSEVFQGKEKPVMIVSTVRTGGSIGFVDNQRVRSKFNLENLSSSSFNNLFNFHVFYSG